MADIEKQKQLLEERLYDIVKPLKNYDQDQCLRLLAIFLEINEEHLREAVIEHAEKIRNISKEVRKH